MIPLYYIGRYISRSRVKVQVNVNLISSDNKHDYNVNHEWNECL